VRFDLNQNHCAESGSSLLGAQRRLSLDVLPELRRPSEQHIVLLNRDEIDRALVTRNET
jgi:hypothetical protein